MIDKNPASNQRESLRNAVTRPVSLELIGVEQGKIRDLRIEGTSVDISSGGLGMITNGTLRKGDVLKLHLSVNDMQVTLPILSEVMWLQKMNGEYRAGLQFLA